MTAKLPELLAPVSDWESLRAAVHNGADAVYFGMPNFNARGRAPLIDLEQIRAMIEFCHLYGVHVYIAFNVLIFERELPEVIKPLLDAMAMGPDAFIVQDTGLARLMHFLAPDQVVHASTQMSITSAEGIAFTSDLNIKRYILARELSINEIAKISAETDKELESFVHGALCVSYSGQCLTSESFGGRSANRGQCSQSCRWPYELIVDGEKRDLGSKRYLVSPQDLCGMRDIPRLIDAGVHGLKIEGRLKSAEYVAQTVQNYRRALDSGSAAEHVERAVEEMGVVYSRGFSNGWLDGVDHQRLVPAEYPNHHGLEIGTVAAIQGDKVLVATDRTVELGDGIVFADFNRETEGGGTVFGVRSADGGLSLKFDASVDLHKVRRGMKVFRNAAPRIEKELRRSYTDKTSQKRIPVCARVWGSRGEPLRLELRDPEGRTVQTQTDALLEEAKKAPVTDAFLRDEIGALSGTAFSLASCEIELPDSVFVHHREIKKLRQKATEELTRYRSQAPIRIEKSETEALHWFNEQNATALQTSQGEPTLNILVREKEQIGALRGLSIGTVYLDFEYGKEYTQAVEEVRSMGFRAGIATTRILKPGENSHLKQIARLRPDDVLVRNFGALEFLKDSGLCFVGDFSLNAANSLSARWLFDKGLARLCPSYDLNHQQLCDLLEKIGGARCEITVHQYMPAFHMEHCVFAAFLSNGSSFRDCGRPCEHHRVALRDEKGAEHPVKADAECRNTMFNGTPQSAARLIPVLRDLGVRHFRLEALFEDAATLRTKAEAYLDVLKGASEPETLFSRLGIAERYGVSEGQIFNDQIYQLRRKEARGSAAS